MGGKAWLVFFQVLSVLASCLILSSNLLFPFQSENDWEETPLLCASAGWGAGSFVVVRGQNETVNIATTGTVSKKTADLFCIKEMLWEE
jgi:hypothetical protein